MHRSSDSSMTRGESMAIPMSGETICRTERTVVQYMAICRGDLWASKGFLNGPVVDVHGPVRHDKGLVSQVLICELAPACKGVVPADHDLIGLPEAGMGAVFWILREIGPLSSFRVHAGDKDHIQLPFMEILKERRGGGFPDLDLHAGVELGKLATRGARRLCRPK